MRVEDPVYGQFEVEEPVLVELIDSRSVQRLKGIAQYGIPEPYYPVYGFSRYDHSLGVLLLLRRLGASVVEQAAGLLHDISHTAFSHVTDGLLGVPDFAQDHRHRGFLLNSEVSKILYWHGMDPEAVADIGRHGLLEREAPLLCADRVDYSLREFAPRLNGQKGRLIASLTAFEGRVVFDNREMAEYFAFRYLNTHIHKWASIEKTVRQHLFAEALRSALEESVITLDDLFQDDEHVLRRLTASKSPRIKATLSLLSRKLEFEEDSNGQIQLPRRVRHVDPEYLDHGVPVRLSDANKRYAEEVRLQKKILQKGLSVNIRNVR